MPSNETPRHPSQLDEHRADIVTWKVAGVSDRVIADNLGVANSTVSRYVARQEVRSDIAAARHELLQESMSGLLTASKQAVVNLVDMLRSDDPAIKAIATRDALRYSGLREIIVETMTGDDSTVAPTSQVAASARAKAAAIEARLAESDDDEGTPELAAVQ